MSRSQGRVSSSLRGPNFGATVCVCQVRHPTYTAHVALTMKSFANSTRPDFGVTVCVGRVRHPTCTAHVALTMKSFVSITRPEFWSYRLCLPSTTPNLYRTCRAHDEEFRQQYAARFWSHRLCWPSPTPNLYRTCRAHNEEFRQHYAARILELPFVFAKYDTQPIPHMSRSR